jgi:hypothetical protein
MNDNIAKIAGKLTKAQQRYLLALEPNRIDPGASSLARTVQREFQNRDFRKPIGLPGLPTAWALIDKVIVKARPQPCECGWHYASLTPCGLQVRDYLQRNTDEQG